MPSVNGPQYSEEELVVRERVKSITDMPSVREPGTYGNHAPIGSQEIPVSMDNVRTEGTAYQYVTSTSGKALGRNLHVWRSKRIIKYPQRYNPGFGYFRECNNDAVASIVYMIKNWDLNRNVDMDDIL